MKRSGFAVSVLVFQFALLAAACGNDAGYGREAGAEARVVLLREIERIRVRADSVDALFQPLPLLRPAEEARLRRFGNAAQLVAARRLGIAPDPSTADIERLRHAGTLVRLADSTVYWVVRDLDHSAPYLTPDAEAHLRAVGERFQAALKEIGAPAFRLEVTSMLRSAEDQARLRRVNPNAAAGQTTHAFGTTFDIAYSAFAAPARPAEGLTLPQHSWLAPHLAWTDAMLAERTAARRSRELMAVLGKVLLEMQAEGRLMVTLERLQPVYHITIARPAD